MTITEKEKTEIITLIRRGYDLSHVAVAYDIPAEEVKLLFNNDKEAGE